MLFQSKATQEQRLEILREREAIGDVEAAQRLLQIDPDYAPAFLIRGNAVADKGDLVEAESLFWKGLDLHPLGFAFYFTLGDLRRKRDTDDAMANHLTQLAMWKLSFAEEVPDSVAEVFQRKSVKVDFKDPESYAMMATVFEVQHQDDVEPADVRDRLLPYRLLNDLQRQAPAAVHYRLVQDIVANSERCAPLFHTALKEWARTPAVLSHQALALIVALLGEIAGADLLDDLLELSTFDDFELFLHTHWAIWRLGQRFPATALAKFKSATPGASLAMRCGLAEHISMLPETEGIKPALVELLEGASGLADNPEDAPYLLMVVTEALIDFDEEEKAETLLAQYQGILSKQGRKTLQEYLDAEEGFLPTLIAEDIDEHDIESICVDRVYINDEDEDKEEESAGPKAPTIKPERNDPCWCGSGKKYKKCHLAADEEAARSHAHDPQPEMAPAEPFYQALYRKVFESSPDIHGRAGFAEANRLYFEQPVEEVDPEEASTSGFFEWYVYDYRSSRNGRTLVEEYLRRYGPRLGACERALLESWRATRFGLFEVQSIKKGIGLELKDVFAGDQFFVHDVSSSRETVKWDCIFTRVQEYEGQQIFSGNGFMLPRPFLPRLRAMVEEESRETGQTSAEFVRAHSHRWFRAVMKMHQEQLDGLRMVNAEGDPIEFCSAAYRVSDETALADTLAALEFFEETTGKDETPGTRHFGWLETGVKDEGPRRSYGHIEIRDGRLRLECTSRRRLGIGRQLLEKNAASFLKHEGDVFESLDAAKKRIGREGPAKEKAKTIPPEVEKVLLLKMKTEHYAKWPDESLPALDGKTPRAAVRTEVGRAAVENLIRMMENGEEKLRKDGQAAYDFSQIRETLGLNG